MIYGVTVNKSDIVNLHLKKGDSVVLCNIPAGATLLDFKDNQDRFEIWYDDNKTKSTISTV